jgi:hypothetical protein
METKINLLEIFLCVSAAPDLIRIHLVISGIKFVEYRPQPAMCGASFHELYSENV